MTKTNKSHPGMQLQPHELALLIPEMSQSEYEALKDDIKANGQIEPIRTYEGKILDGRHRYRACCELEIEPIVEPWGGEGDPFAFVVSMNLTRRNFSRGQLTLLVAKLERQLAQLARARQHGGGNKKAQRAGMPQAPDNGAKGGARDQAARLIGVCPPHVSEAKRLCKDSPQLAKEVKAGRLSLPEAMRQLAGKQEQRRPAARDSGRTQSTTAGQNSKIDTRNDPAATALPDTEVGTTGESVVTGAARVSPAPHAGEEAGEAFSVDDLLFELNTDDDILHNDLEPLQEAALDRAAVWQKLRPVLCSLRDCVARMLARLGDEEQSSASEATS